MEFAKFLYVGLVIAVSGLSCAQIIFPDEQDPNHQIGGGNGGGGASGAAEGGAAGVAGAGGHVAGVGGFVANCTGTGDAGINDEPCTPGSCKECYTGATSTRNIGACRDGIATCQADSQWGPCEGEVLPQYGICDGTDADCNGKVGDCLVPGKLGNCGPGACQDGTCVQKVFPTDHETCSGNDDSNCDGKYDLPPGGMFDGECDTGTPGVCSAGTWQCVSPEDVFKCVPMLGASPETCDGLDNDCDGIADDEIPPTPCVPPGTPGGLSYGSPSQCKMGTKVCGSMDCSGFVGPSANEVCGDCIDNDCNSMVDDDVGCVNMCPP